jgi:hypothetical protein
VQFVNDAWDGTAATDGHDRDVYIGSITMNGATEQGQAFASNNASLGRDSIDPHAAVMLTNGTVAYNVPAASATPTPAPVPAPAPAPAPAPTPAPSSGSTTPDNSSVTLHVSGDHWVGHAGADPQFVVLVDGQQVGGVQTVTAVHDSNQWQDITVTGSFSNAKEIDVKFVNDQYGGSHAQDVNLYVDSITVGGQKFIGTSGSNDASQGYNDTIDPNAAVMVQNGTLAFQVGTSTPTPTPAPAPAPAPAPVFLSSTFSDGAGHDVFIFNTAAATGKDIANFDTNADVLDLAPALKAAGYTGSDPIADHVVTLIQSGTDATAVKIDATGHDPSHGTTLVTLDHVLPQDVHAANIWH